MKRLLLVLNGKGGVGKSFFAVTLVQYLKDRGVPHTAIDTDNENSTLKRFHPDAAFVDIGVPRQLDAVFAPLATSKLVVVDCRAASTDLFLDHFQEVALDEVLAEWKVQLTLCIPVNHEADSADQVQRLVEAFGRKAQYLIVRNAVHSESFALYESLAVRRQLLEEYRSPEITIPRLQDWLVEGMNRENLTITEAIASQTIPLLDRQRLRAWQRRVYSALDGVRKAILPAEGETS